MGGNTINSIKRSRSYGIIANPEDGVESSETVRMSELVA